MRTRFAVRAVSTAVSQAPAAPRAAAASTENEASTASASAAKTTAPCLCAASRAARPAAASVVAASCQAVSRTDSPSAQYAARPVMYMFLRIPAPAILVTSSRARNNPARTRGPHPSPSARAGRRWATCTWSRLIESSEERSRSSKAPAPAPVPFFGSLKYVTKYRWTARSTAALASTASKRSRPVSATSTPATSTRNEPWSGSMTSVSAATRAWVGAYGSRSAASSSVFRSRASSVTVPPRLVLIWLLSKSRSQRPQSRLTNFSRSWESMSGSLNFCRASHMQCRERAALPRGPITHRGVRLNPAERTLHAGLCKAA